ncbi:inositol monophosphatase family protein [Thauera linaloolentis]|nr:inositol monophosphatase family protein [Thauera linaloolentis]MCM8564551.1 inositol monophosphatase family protein [Thauera linaloolentis]
MSFPRSKPPSNTSSGSQMLDFLTDGEKELVDSMTRLGHDLIAWRNDPSARHSISSHGLKLQADRWAHERLVDKLTQIWPHIPVISEEDASHCAHRPQQYWLIDPIDGTASWLHGFDGFVTQVALMEDGQPVAGFVNAPMRANFYIGLAGRGAFLNGIRIPARMENELHNPVIVDNTPEPHGIVEELMRRIPLQYRESGSLGLKCCMISNREADLFVKDVLVRDWDLAPAFVILNEIGGVLLQRDGSPYLFEGSWEKTQGFIAAATPSLSRRIIDALSSFSNSAI